MGPEHTRARHEANPLAWILILLASGACATARPVEDGRTALFESIQIHEAQLDGHAARAQSNHLPCPERAREVQEACGSARAIRVVITDSGSEERPLPDARARHQAAQRRCDGLRLYHQRRCGVPAGNGRAKP